MTSMLSVSHHIPPTSHTDNLWTPPVTPGKSQDSGGVSEVLTSGFIARESYKLLTMENFGILGRLLPIFGVSEAARAESWLF